jgi:hypothetical protein
VANSQSDIDPFKEAKFFIPNSSDFSRLYCVEYILTKLDREYRRMALTISDDSKQKFEGANIQPPEYILIRFIEEWELSDSDILNFDYLLGGGIRPKWGTGERSKESLLQIGVVIRLNLLYQIRIGGLICPSPNDCEWVRVGKIEVVK